MGMDKKIIKDKRISIIRKAYKIIEIQEEIDRDLKEIEFECEKGFEKTEFLENKNKNVGDKDKFIVKKTKIKFDDHISLYKQEFNMCALEFIKDEKMIDEFNDFIRNIENK